MGILFYFIFSSELDETPPQTGVTVTRALTEGAGARPPGASRVINRDISAASASSPRRFKPTRRRASLSSKDGRAVEGEEGELGAKKDGVGGVDPATAMVARMLEKEGVGGVAPATAMVTRMSVSSVSSAKSSEGGVRGVFNEGGETPAAAVPAVAVANDALIPDADARRSRGGRPRGRRWRAVPAPACGRLRVTTAVAVFGAVRGVVGADDVDASLGERRRRRRRRERPRLRSCVVSSGRRSQRLRDRRRVDGRGRQRPTSRATTERRRVRD